MRLNTLLLALSAPFICSLAFVGCGSDDPKAPSPSRKTADDAGAGGDGPSARAGASGKATEPGGAGGAVQGGAGGDAVVGGKGGGGMGAGGNGTGGMGDGGKAGDGGEAGGGNAGSSGSGTSGGAAGSSGASGGAGAGGAPGKCVKTICMGGAVQSDPYEGGNVYLAPLCEKLPGLVPNCDAASGTCIPMWGWLDGKAPARQALYRALDSSGDGFLDDSDIPCDIRLVGYSWGGFNARDIAQAWADDPNVPSERKAIAMLVAIDPYRVGDLEYPVPTNVKLFREYRHTVAPADDCSGGAPLGPYKGLDPRCGPGSDCRDYDYSIAPKELFPTLSGVPKNVAGKDVEHCNAADVAAVPVLALLTGAAEPKLPPTTPVKPLKPL